MKIHFEEESAFLSMNPTSSDNNNNNVSFSATPLRDNNVKLKIGDFYTDRVIFCTGCTGFLGKVLLEKILRCLPQVRKVYVLVRAKKGGSPQERMIDEILRSPIMKVLKEKFDSEQAFMDYALSKLEAVPGDVATPEFIHLPEKDLNRIKNEISVVIHSAATIGFQERLDDAIKLNVYGALAALEFSRSCPNLTVFSHISTAFVNSNMKSGSRVEEKQYQLKLPGNEDPEDFCRRVMQMSPAEIEQTTRKYLKHFGYPNTYTITKRLAETLVTKNRGNVKIAVIRPTIVGAALKEPFPGWVDTVSAGGSVYLFVGLGVISMIPGDKRKVSDQIPVDYVINGMIIATADVGASSQKNICRTYHLGTSVPRPGKWAYTEQGIMKYWRSHRPSKSIAPASFTMILNPYVFNTRFYMKYTWLAQVYGLFASAVQSKKHLKMAKNLQKLESKANMFTQHFRHFTLNEWFFETSNLEQAYSQMTDDEQKVFFLDWESIDWETYFEYFCYGLHKYILKENPDSIPTAGNVLDVNKNDLFSDLTFAISAAGEFNARWSREELKRMVLGSRKVQFEIQKEAEKQSLPFGEVEDRAMAIMDKMFADPKMKTVRFLTWTLRKVWRKLYSSIIIDHEELAKVKELTKNENAGTLVFIPTHRSYVDFLVLSYIFFAYDIPVPHVAAGEDFLNMFLLRNMFRHSGAFFIRRSFGNDLLYKTIFSEYVQHLLIDGCPVEFFVEGTRSRYGKTLHPKLGLLSIIAESYLDKKVSNITIVPVHISYEKLMESEAYSNELLGEPKKKESLRGLVKARDVLKNRYGDIHVKIASPISLKDYVNDISAQETTNFDPFADANDRFSLVRKLAYSITTELNDASVVMPTSLIATILLTYRDGISLDELTAKTHLLKQQVILRGCNVNWSEQQSTSAIMDRALNLLNNLVVKRKHMIEPAIDTKADYKKTIQLSCYRNSVIYIFVREAIVSCSLESFGNRKNEGVTRVELVQSSKFLADLLKFEFVYKDILDTTQDFSALIDLMIQREILKSRTDEQGNELIYIVASSENEIHKILCAMLWPFIESYWATSMAMISLQFSGSESGELDHLKESVLLQRIQWLIEKLYFENRLYYYESCCMDTIKNAITLFLTWKVMKRVKKEEESGKKGQVTVEMYLQLLPPYTEMDKLFGLVEQIQQYRRTTQPMSMNRQLPERKIHTEFMLPSKL
jgi:1-acyl-sn-glycerol-3-phosphate acyltransferase/nucleoside-diphosphate-sugar epimerase